MDRPSAFVPSTFAQSLIPLNRPIQSFMDGSSPDSLELITADVEAKTIRLSFALNAGIEDIEETFENGYVPDQYKTPLNISRAAARIITNFELKSTDRVSTRPISCYFHAKMTVLLQNSRKSAF